MDDTEKKRKLTNVCILHVKFLLLNFFIVFVVILESPCIIGAITKDLVNLIPSAEQAGQGVERRRGEPNRLTLRRFLTIRVGCPKLSSAPSPSAVVLYASVPSQLHP